MSKRHDGKWNKGQLTMFDLTKGELAIFRKLNTPKKIQDFLNRIPINFDYRKDTFMSPRMVLKKGKCHCAEGAVLAALCLKIHGHKPLILDLTATKNDYDHVIAVFKKNGKWGAISKTNHTVLRYREPVYNSIRELVMSFFHEYFDDKGRKNLRSYSLPVDLSRFDKENWAGSWEDLWHINEYLEKVKHYPILNKKQISGLRKADKTEIKAGKIVEWGNNYKGKKKRNENE
ncbi:hypothetical protein HZB88_01005 [archaeon]|nr:hypothetical protein [archaeon]